MHVTNKLMLTTLTVALAIWNIAPPARASSASVPAILDPNDTVNPLPNFPATASFVTGGEGTTFSFDGGSGPVGSLTEYVITTPTNPFSPEGDVFAFSIAVTSGDVASIALSGFAGWDTAVKTCGNGCVEGTGPVPDSAKRSASGDVVTFIFDTDLAAGNSSGGFNIYTNATGFADPFGTVTDSSGDTASFSFNGPAATPLPAALPLFAGGLGFIGLLALRKRKNAVSFVTA
jgi:hypothetical protein